ncbi:MAG TPA: hypothetical protein VFO16_16320 [Pseudonocardiaceae bacterium]|nr:hypothetical protein [Pseudonocardiaceae bacterium]
MILRDVSVLVSAFRRESPGGRLATADRGFARFERLDWFDPAQA